MIPGRSRTGVGAYCVGKCLTYDLHKKRGESIYKYAVLCSHCNAYIPRGELVKKTGYKKYQCPCCKRNWLKGIYKLNCM